MLTQPIKPMLLTMEKEAFNDNRYLWEIKWDGWRIILVKEGERIDAFTRNGRRVTEKFPELQEVAAGIKCHSAVIDCEGVCIRDGRSIFDDSLIVGFYQIRLRFRPQPNRSQQPLLLSTCCIPQRIIQRRVLPSASSGCRTSSSPQNH